MNDPHISPLVLRLFRGIVRGYFRRHFTAVRLSRSSDLGPLTHAPNTNSHLILYANHSSWWDPMVSVLLAEKLMPTRRHYAPMDAESLSRYKVLQRIGIFGVDLNTLRGAARFIRASLKVLQAGGVLWITPQGRFVDTRERPLVFKPGLAALAARVPGGCTVVPIAIEYVFWDERLPEVLLHFGQAVHTGGRDAAELEQPLETALLETMETLKQMAIARRPDLFYILQRGRAGTGGFYALGQRALAFLRRRPYRPEHTRRVPAAETPLKDETA